VARLGGDEFALLMPETGPEGAQIALSRLRTRLVESLGSRKMPVTFSFGAATFLKAPDSAEEAVKKAGVQMYSAKNAGANSIDQEVFGGEE
jgi:diguanylate cyclase (GGDEF)-like protein